MRVFFLHRALEAILDQNECDCLQKKHLSSVLTYEKTEYGWKKISEAQGGHFCDLWSFAKIRDRLPKLGISSEILLSMFGPYYRGIWNIINRFFRRGLTKKNGNHSKDRKDKDNDKYMGKTKTKTDKDKNVREWRIIRTISNWLQRHLVSGIVTYQIATAPMPPTAAPRPRSTGRRKTAPGDDEPLSNSNCLERLREFQLKMHRGRRGSICLMYQQSE